MLALENPPKSLHETNYPGVNLVRFSRNGRQLLAAVGYSGPTFRGPYSIQMFDADQGGLITKRDGLSSYPVALSFIADTTNFVFLTNDGTLHFVGGESQDEKITLVDKRASLDFGVFDRTGRFLLVTLSDGIIRLVDLERRKSTPMSNGLRVPIRYNAGVVAQDGSAIVVGTLGGQIELYTPTAELRGTAFVDGGVTALNLSGSGASQLLAAGKSRIRIRPCGRPNRV